MIRTILIALVLLWATPAWAHNYPCTTRVKASVYLFHKYQEVWQAHGAVAEAGNMGASKTIRVELWRNKKKKTWTILLVNKKNNVACIIAAGKNWRWAGKKVSE